MAGTPAGAAKRAATRAGAATPTDRKKPIRKSAARKPTAAELGEMPAAKVEAIGEPAAADDGSLAFEFDGDVFQVRSPADWRQSAMASLQIGSFNGWAAGAMDADSAARFAERDFTNRQAADFMDDFDEAYTAAYGDDPKALQERMGLSSSTRRRSR